MFNKPEVQSTGAEFDTRSDKERAKDYDAEELLAGAGYALGEKVTRLTQPVIDQQRTDSCVANATATALLYAGAKINISRLALYRKRINYPGSGANGVDLFSKTKDGQTKYEVLPYTVGMTEAMANAMAYVRGNKLIPEFNYFPEYRYKNTPRYISEGIPVVVFIYATNEEWRQEYVTIRTPNLNPQSAAVRHAVCLIPHGNFMENSKIWYSVHDSAGFGGIFLRYVDENFLRERVYFEAGVVLKEDTVTLPPPTEKPTTPVHKGDRGQAVLNLQNFLIAGGYLEPRYNTAYYGSLTSAAVLWYQLKNHEKFKSNIPTLLDLNGEYWGNESVASLTA